MPCNVYHAWLTQRAQRFYVGLPETDRAAADALKKVDGLAALLGALPRRWIERTGTNTLVLGGSHEGMAA